LEAIPKKMQLSPDLLDALAVKKDLCREKFSVILAYLRKDRPPSSTVPNEWVAVPSAPPKFEGS
jgi:thiazole synthase ThiGH ThiG subunit